MMKVAALMLFFVVICGRRTAGDEPEIIFPDEWHRIQVDRPDSKTQSNDINQLPIDLIRKMNEVDNFEDILLDYLENKNEYLAALRNISNLSPSSISLTNRFGTDHKSEPAQRAKQAECKTELEVVSLVKDLEGSTHYLHYPTCTRIKRCSGCCNHSQMSCQPVKSIQRTFKVFQLMNRRAIKVKKSLQFNSIIDVTVEEHEKCLCGCKTTANDCTNSQSFDSINCTCRCQDNNGQQDCFSQENRIWNDSTCKCECEKISKCTTGSYFDHKECKCMRSF